MEKTKREIEALTEKVGEKLIAIASTETKDRVGDMVKVDGWDLKNFKKNPVLLFAHKYDEPPVGYAKNIHVENNKLVFEPVFHEITQLAREIKAMFMSEPAIMKAWSVGFIPLAYDESDSHIIAKQELLEISAVPVPANAEALMIAAKSYSPKDEKEIMGWLEKMNKEIEIEEKKKPKEGDTCTMDNGDEGEMHDNGNGDMVCMAKKEIKGVIPFSVHGEGAKADEGMAWKASEEVKKATGNANALRKMHAWVDSSAENFNADESKWYKLPHHEGSGSQAVVWRGVAAAMGALLGARGGVDLPEGDRKGVYNHLVKHYAQFEKTPPEFKEYTEAELKEIFEEEFILEADEKVKELEAQIKEGRVLSAKTLETINEAISSMKYAISALKDLRALADKPAEGRESQSQKGRGEVAQKQRGNRVKVQALRKLDKIVNELLRNEKK